MSDRAATESSAFHRPAFLIAAAMLVLCAVAALVLVLSGGSRRSLWAAPAAASSSSAPPSAVTAGAGEVASVCQALPVASEAVPTVTPSVRWVRLGVMEVPSAPSSVGPEVVSDGVGRCFAHSPMGALYAGANVLGSLTAAPQARVISALGAGTSEKAPALAGARVGYNPTLQQELQGTPSISGFSFQSYSPAQADVDIVLSVPSGSQLVIDLSLVWQDGDWRFVIPPGGDLEAAALSSLNDYVAWGQD